MKRSHAHRQSLKLECLEHRWVPSAYVEALEPFGGPSSAGFAVNATGSAVGSADTSRSTTTAALWTLGLGPDFNLGTLGGKSSAAYSINDAGQVVGWSHTRAQSDAKTAFAWDPDHGMQDLGIPGIAYDINNEGQIVGETADGQAFFAPALLSGEANLFGPGRATAINDGGVAVGWTARAYGEARAVIWSGDSITPLGTLRGHNLSEATAINDVGQVVGRSGTQVCDGRGCAWMSSRAFVWNNFVGMKDIGQLRQGDNTVAYGINNGGHVVGSSNGRAFLYSVYTSQMLDLNSLLPRQSDWTLTAATAISDAGWVVGYGELAGVSRGFVMILPPQGDPGVDLPTLASDMSSLPQELESQTGAIPPPLVQASVRRMEPESEPKRSPPDQHRRPGENHVRIRPNSLRHPKMPDIEIAISNDVDRPVIEA